MLKVKVKYCYLCTTLLPKSAVLWLSCAELYSRHRTPDRSLRSSSAVAMLSSSGCSNDTDSCCHDNADTSNMITFSSSAMTRHDTPVQTLQDLSTYHVCWRGAHSWPPRRWTAPADVTETRSEARGRGEWRECSAPAQRSALDLPSRNNNVVDQAASATHNKPAI